MKISITRRVRITYGFWRALGAKNRNTVMAMVHECGIADVSAGQLPEELVKTMQSEMESTGYDYGHET